MATPVQDIIEDLSLLREPRPWWEWAMAALIVAVMMVVIWRWRRWRRGSLATEGLVADQPGDEFDALGQLEAIRHLMTRQTSRQFGIEVSAIVRRYLENRFKLGAPRMSKEEFLAAARNAQGLSGPQRLLLKDFLDSCDFLKFARGMGEVEELLGFHTAAVRFIQQSQQIVGGAPTA